MDTKLLWCERCFRTQDLLRDRITGMWQLSIEHASISNTSWQALEQTWREIHNPDCRQPSNGQRQRPEPGVSYRHS